MALGTSNRDGGRTDEAGHLRAVSKGFDGDVFEGLEASQRAAGANMSVDISVGDALVRRADGDYAHSVFNDAVYNQVIDAADGANPRRDIVVIYVDYNETPSTGVANNTNGVVKIKSVAGTAAGSPVDPTDGAIQSSVGSGNPWTKLARVRVAASATSITDGNIDDLREMAGTKLPANILDTIKDYLQTLVGWVTTTMLGDGSVTPAKRSGGFFMVRHTFGNATGSQSITGVPFRPKAIEVHSTINEGGGANNNAIMSVGKAVDGSPIVQGATSVASGSAPVWATRSAANRTFLRASGSGGETFGAEVTSFDSDGVTVNVTTTSATAENRRYDILFLA